VRKTTEGTGNSITIINASPLAMGLITTNGPSDWHPASSELKQRCANAAKYCSERNVDISKLALAFVAKGIKGKNKELLHHPSPSFSVITTQGTLVSCTSIQQLESNLKVWKDGLNEEENEVLADIMSLYFERSADWVGVEVKQYRQRDPSLSLETTVD
jgi:L-galactose dehydrogenase